MALIWSANSPHWRHYDLVGYKPYRQEITQQYRRLGALPSINYGKTGGQYDAPRTRRCAVADAQIDLSCVRAIKISVLERARGFVAAP